METQTKESPTDKVSRLFEKHKEKFHGMFHSLLWKLIVDDIRAGKMSALTTNYTDNGLIIGIADHGKRGYTPTGVYFKEDIKHDDAEKVIAEFNTEIFGLGGRTAAEIVLNTMRK